jgi:cytochrome c-type biogenesis protein CcmE
MTRKRQRVVSVVVCGICLASGVGLALSALHDNLVFFLSPSDFSRSEPTGRQVRLGGLVEQGTVEKMSQGEPGMQFKVTDGNASVRVVFRGVLPDLFREGQGVVVLGSEQADGIFRASEVLAKHDEVYMPKEVADALKKSGRWNPSDGKLPPLSTSDPPARHPS